LAPQKGRPMPPTFAQASLEQALSRAIKASVGAIAAERATFIGHCLIAQLEGTKEPPLLKSSVPSPRAVLRLRGGGCAASKPAGPATATTGPGVPQPLQEQHMPSTDDADASVIVVKEDPVGGVAIPHQDTLDSLGDWLQENPLPDPSLPSEALAAAPSMVVVEPSAAGAMVGRG
jgi:hypothetical protein